MLFQILVGGGGLNFNPNPTPLKKRNITSLNTRLN